MAISVGKKSEEFEVKRYIGVGKFNILSVNPCKEEIEKLYNTTLEKEPEYVGIKKDTNTPQIRIDFIAKEETLNFITRFSFFINKEEMYNKDKTKVQMINNYGETTWLTVEDAEKGVIPDNQKWFRTEGIRPAYQGEEALIGFLKAFLNIQPKSYKKADGTEVINSDEDSTIYIENWDNYFKGNVKELKDIISSIPDYKVKALLGVKKVDGKEYQDVFSKMFLKNSIRNYDRLNKELIESKNAGSYPNTEFDVMPIEEYTVTPTKFDKTVEDMPPVHSFFNKK